MIMVDGTIKQRIRNKKGKHVGVMLAWKVDGNVRVGWSTCNINKDKYDKTLAERIAAVRGRCGTKVQPPKYAVAQIAAFTERANKYFNNPAPRKREKATA